ncbi:endolytic transglycosylase MltG [bacterium]|nr:MAG: endolytic transglycosylase MltG [bacterium]
MIRKFWPFLLLIFMILIFLGMFKMLKDYRSDQAQRVAEMQKKAEEVKVTIIEGLNTEEIAEKLEDAGMFNKDQFMEAVENFDTTNFPIIQKPGKTLLEGYLFPDTYRFAKDATPASVIDTMLKNFVRRMSSIGVTVSDDKFIIPGYENLKPIGGDGQSGLSLYDVLVLASIIELESGDSSNMSLAEERGLVAGVFYNRMLIGQALESDATVNYVTGKSDPGVSIRDTQVNSPYNTYRYAGLPPGPIGNPSLGSIQAALNPTKSDYYYFLHKQPSGEAVFSKTFEEHVRNKQR